jgi:hypothetical protein
MSHRPFLLSSPLISSANVSCLSDEEQQSKQSSLILGLLQFFLKVVQSLQLSSNDAEPLKKITEVLLEEVCYSDIAGGKSKKSIKAALTQCLKSALDILPAAEMVDIAVNVAGRGKQFVSTRSRKLVITKYLPHVIPSGNQPSPYYKTGCP